VGTVRAAERPDAVTRANAYIADVLAGKIPVCKWTRLACERQQSDLARRSDPSFPWRLDEERAIRVANFIELSPHIKGRKFAGKPLILEPWQCFAYCTPFGWVHKQTGLRRYRRVYLQVAKGNGKSPVVAALCNYMGFADGEPGAEVYTAAHGIKQARVVFDTSRAMLEKMPDFCSRFGIVVGQHAIYQQRTNSYIHPLSREARIAEGSLPYFICADELHVWPKRELFDNLATANEKRDGSMMFGITTAGTDLSSVCYEQYEYLQKILDRVIQDATYWGCIWTIDDKDDPWDELAWRKANPNWGVSVNPDSIRHEAERARQIASAQPAFLTKHLNVWLQTDHAWMDMHRFLKCGDPRLREEDFASYPCVIGADLAAKLDLASVLRTYWQVIDAKVHYYAFGTHWTPQARVDASNNASYKGWARDRHLQVTAGQENDFDAIEEFIRQHTRKAQVHAIAHDPAQAVEVIQHLKKDRLPCVEVPQRWQYLSEPMKELEAAVYSGRFHYNGDPVLAWAMSNVVCHPDKNDNLFPNKTKQENKIDPVTALLTAKNRVMALKVTGIGQPRRTKVLVF
jgi:phage terminase large subunit-like protein